MDQFDNLNLYTSGNAFKKLPVLHNPFFITVTPGSLHILEICLNHIPSQVDLVLILNGLEKWETTFIKENWPVKGLIRIDNLPGRMIPHGKILDFLFNHYNEPFGILDFDCFVLKSSIFERISKLENNSLLNAYFVKSSGVFDIPETFLMFFNTPVINKIRDEYNIGCSETQYSNQSQKTKETLKKIGVDESQYPDNRNFYDTLHLLISLGIANGYSINYIEKLKGKPTLNSEVFHIGGITIRNKTSFEKFNEVWKIRRLYFWQRALESTSNNQIRQKYSKKYWHGRSEDIIENHSGSREKIGEDFFYITENLISKKK